MKERNILFQVKSLEKIILRRLVPDEIEKQNISDIEKRPTPTQMQIIGYILKNMDKEVYQRDLEESLNLRRATISDVLQRMEKNGLVKREINSNDIRSKKILLTDKSKKFFEAGTNRMRELEKIAIKDITDEELQIFSNVINKMIENMNENEKGKE